MAPLLAPSKGNVGENDEILITKTLLKLRGRFVPSLNFIIETVADYSGRIHKDNSGFITKAPVSSKRDITINGKGFSLKSSRAAPPAIVNHTTREKWLKVCDRRQITIDLLDGMVSEYWKLRMEGRIGEDIHTTSSLCPFGCTKEHQLYLKKLVDYFLFDGTGSALSNYPADYILEFNDPLNPNTWRILDRDTAFFAEWPKMVFSIRSKKGMPSNYPNINPAQKALMEPWVRFIDGDYRGALHIRAKK